MSMPKPLIAIVDDDQTVRDSTLDLFQSLGFRAVAFASAADLLAAECAAATACLIADMQMPGMTGLELHHRLLAAGRTMPTILITAYPDDTDRVRALTAGVSSYLAKPFSDQ